MVRLASWFNQNRGVVTVCRVVEGDLATEQVDIHAEREAMDETLASEGLVAFAKVDVVPDFETGILGIAQANGFAGLASNTLMFGWPNSPDRLLRLLRMMRAVSRVKMSTIIARLPDTEGPTQRRTIDVWWRGKQHNGDLMLLLSHLLNLNPEWRQARVAVRTIVASEADREAATKPLAELLADARIDAKTDVVVRPPDKSVRDVIHEASRDADVVFLGLMVPNTGEEAKYAAKLTKLAEGLRTVVFVRSAGRYAGDLL